MDKPSELRSMIVGNIVLTQLQAIVVGFLAALVSLAMGWVPQGHFNIRHALVLCSSSIATASIASLALGKSALLLSSTHHPRDTIASFRHGDDYCRCLLP